MSRFNPGSSVGKLRIVPAEIPEEQLTFDPGEIVVLKAVLSDITPVAGIISETFSTPALAPVAAREGVEDPEHRAGRRTGEARGARRQGRVLRGQGHLAHAPRRDAGGDLRERREARGGFRR
jgi:hypothetical protein